MAKYEIHSAFDPKYPFIFHTDDIFEYSYSYANWHKNIEILYVISGQGELLLNFVPFKLRAGDIAVINSNAVHSTRTSVKLKYHCLIIDENFLEFSGIKGSDFIFESIIKNDENLIETYKTAALLLSKKNENSEFEKKLAVLNLVNLLIKNHSQRSENTYIYDQEEFLKPTLEYIKKEMKSKITVSSLAKNVGYSDSYFIHTFKKLTGYTVTEFINIQRCLFAREMLKNKLSVEYAAKESGFNSVSYFSRAYKKTFGDSPKKDKK